MELLTLIENTTFHENLTAEHGLSFLIKTNGKNILFDTGTSGIFMDNLLKLNENPDDIDYIVLSHGHYDHTGGMKKILEYYKAKYLKNEYPKDRKLPEIFLKKEALYFKYKKVNNDFIDKGFKIRKNLKNYPNKIIFIDKYHKLNDNIYILGNIKRYNDFEGENPGYFYFDDFSNDSDNENFSDTLFKKSKPDIFNDEIVLIIKDKKVNTLNIITGCSHNGIINIVKTAINFFKINKINIVAGGFHLKAKSHNYILKIINEFKKIDFNLIGINHCSGFEAYRLFKNEFNEKVKYLSTGEKLYF